jgi:hypothetical protein
MSNNELMLGMTEKTRLRASVTYLMLKGAGYAALFVLVIGLFVAVTAWFGRNVLPEDAQLADDPAPQAFADLAANAAAADAAAMAPATDAEAAPAEGEGEATTSP